MNALNEAHALGIREMLTAESNTTWASPADIIADIMHYCRQEGLDFIDQMKLAMVYFLDEVIEEDV